MDIKSISGVTCYVKNIAATAQFYDSLGFRIGDKGSDHLRVYVNWFSIQFFSSASDSEFSAEVSAKQKGTGMFLSMKVDDVEDYYKQVIEKGLKPVTKPRKVTSGNHEFVILDPDGYKLIFFSK